MGRESTVQCAYYRQMGNPARFASMQFLALPEITGNSNTIASGIGDDVIIR